MCNFVDTHCHLTFPPLFDDLDQVLTRARHHAVNHVVVPAFDAESWDLVRQAARRTGVYAAYGIHPWAASKPFDLHRLEEFLDGPKVVAVGEIGLDFKVDVDRDQQIKILTEQLKIAAEKKLPVILHCRGAFEPLIKILTEFDEPLSGVVHAFSRSPELARRFIKKGLMIAFGGTITRKQAVKARKSVAQIPLDSILLETDAPSIGLQSVPAIETEPCHVAQIARTIAQIREEDLEVIARSTTDNAEKLFKLSIHQDH